MFVRLLQLGIIAYILVLTAPSAQAGLIVSRPLYVGLNSGLVGYWAFDGSNTGTTSAYDLSGSGNTGWAINGPLKTNGRLGQGLQFDGADDFVNMGDVLDFPDPNNFSLAAWIRPKTIDTSDERVIISKWGGSDDNRAYKLEISTNRQIQFVQRTETSVFVTSLTVLSPAVWYHVALTVSQSGNRAELYINGVREDSVSFAEILANSSGNFTLGHQDHSNVEHFDGLIDDVRVYNRALSGEEVRRLYNIGSAAKLGAAPSTLPKNGLVGHWTFDGVDTVATSSGVYAGDKSGNSNHARATTSAVRPNPVMGKIGQALEFDGVNDYVDAGNASTLNNLGPVTYSAWIKPTASGQRILSKDFSEIYVSTAIIQFYRCFLVGCADDISRSSTQGVDLNQWQHILVTWDGATLASGVHIYKNGIDVSGSEDNGSGAPTDDSSQHFFIGRDLLGNTFRGVIDEVRVYNRVLSEAEIKRLYVAGLAAKANATPNTLTSGLVGHWTFDGKNMGTTSAYDISGSGNTGWLQNGPIAKIGKIGQALEFDGTNDHVYVSSSLNLGFLNGPLTVCLWTKLDVLPGNDSQIAFVSNGNSSQQNYQYQMILENKSGVMNWSLWWGNTGIFEGWESILPTSANTWYHFCSSRVSDSSVQNYRDGVAVSTVQIQGATIPNTGLGNTAVGRDGDNSSMYVDGLIDDVRIYNRVLSGDEVMRLYNMGR